MAFDPTRLYVSLLNTGLQTKDNPLYQVIHDLIGLLAAVNSQVTTVVNTPASSTPGPQGLQGIPGDEGMAGEDTPPIMGPQGVPGQQGPQGNPGPVGILEDGLDGEFFPPMQGQPGNTGPQGITGPPGPMGFSEPGEDGDFFIALPGPQGNPGIQGVAGPPGPSVPSSDEGIGSDDSITTFGLPVPANQMVPYFIGVNEVFLIPQNKQAVFAMNIEVQGILEIDGFLTEVETATTGEVTVTTTGNIDNLNFSDAALILMNNASDATIRGLQAGLSGQRVTIVSIGAGNVFLSHQNTNSTAANRLINTITTTDTPMAFQKGYATYEYDGVTLRWRMISHLQGATFAYTPVWTANSVNPSLGNGTLLGSYEVIGRKVSITLSLTIGSTTTLGTGFWIFTVPIALTGASQLGIAFGQVNISGANFTGMTTFTDSTHFVVLDTRSSNLFDSTHPFAWTTNDTLSLSMTYQGT